MVFYCVFFRHGLARTDYHIAFDPKLCFKGILNEMQEALVAASAASATEQVKTGKYST